MDNRNLSTCRKGNMGEVEKSEDLFQEGVRCTEGWDIWRGKDKSHKYFYFDQLVFLLPHLEDTETQSNLSTQSNEDEEEVNNLQEEKELPHNVRRKKRTTAKALAKSRGSVSASNCSFGSGSWGGSREVAVLLPDPCQRTQANHPGEVHKVIQGLNVGKAPDPNVIPKSLEASSPVCGIPPFPNI